ncbi:hypothetical protein B4N89_42015 [Embleya scabrispora]|uniref:Cholesterol esterase n=1 Tax=Embleya scabrispora TaxID=159449 RepID=A0A1T3NK67_9ACTN|nr:DUF6230 family protein [Embleya scabrispora]OPC77138.1 hypothetical protein B4N89_42015 [Embleya scabrispora]
MPVSDPPAPRVRRARRAHPHTEVRRFALIATGALALSAGTLWGTIAAGVPVSFAVSGGTFRISADHLSGKDAVQFASYRTDAGDRRHPVAVAGIADARLTNLCQSSVAHTPFGDLTLTIRSGPNTAVRAEHLVIDLDRLNGDMTFGQVQMGRDAATLDAVPGVVGTPGAYGQQARTLEIDKLRVQARSITAGTFSLTDASMSITAGDHSCP